MISIRINPFIELFSFYFIEFSIFFEFTEVLLWLPLNLRFIVESFNSLCEFILESLNLRFIVESLDSLDSLDSLVFSFNVKRYP